MKYNTLNRKGPHIKFVEETIKSVGDYMIFSGKKMYPVIKYAKTVNEYIQYKIKERIKDL